MGNITIMLTSIGLLIIAILTLVIEHMQKGKDKDKYYTFIGVLLGIAGLFGCIIGIGRIISSQS